MENVFDIKRDNNLNFILPKEVQIGELSTKTLSTKALIIIHLHYLETVENYIKWIEVIPAYADIIITVSDDRLEQLLQERNFKGKDHCRIFHKQNRGRDISSFLVTCRKEILKYEYVCFLHDKKAKSESMKEDVEKWIYSLWENSIASTTYINNIILTFLKNPELGVLVPPLLISERHSSGFENAWSVNFDLMTHFAQRLELNCNLDKDKPPITIGTVFWARVDALRKLFEVKWQYDDFDEEPLKGDGTLSHVIERCFAYVAQDAGYETGWVMTDLYAGERMHYVEAALQQAFELLEHSLGIRNILNLICFKENAKRIQDFCRDKDNIYIYGAGTRGKRCLLFTDYLAIKVKAFLVTDKTENGNTLRGNPIIAFEDENITDNSGIIVAVNQKYQQQVVQQINKKCKGKENIYIFR